MITKKKLTGLKKGFSSFENKKLKNLQSVQGGDYRIRSNEECGEGCYEYNVYDDNGKHLRKYYLTIGPITSEGAV